MVHIKKKKVKKNTLLLAVKMKAVLINSSRSMTVLLIYQLAPLSDAEVESSIC